VANVIGFFAETRGAKSVFVADRCCMMKNKTGQAASQGNEPEPAKEVK